MLKALVISPNEKTADFGSLLAIARAEACLHRHVQKNPTAIAILILLKIGGCRVIHG